MYIDGITPDWGDIFRILYWLNSVIAIWISVRVILANRNPVTTFAWMFVLLFLPYIGLLLYFFFGRDTRRRKYIGRRFLSQIKQRSHLSYRMQPPRNIPAEYSHIMSFFENVADAYPMSGNDVSIIDDCKQFAQLLLQHIASAKKHIHLQFYIFENDVFGRTVRDALIEKAHEGVEVRVIYDSVGCLSVNKDFFDAIRRAGGYVESFLRVYFPLLTNKVNYRNHRKIAVIDGRVGFIGGCNIADRYLNGINGKAWRDTMLMIRGGGVCGLQTSFLVDWYFANRSLVSGKLYYPQPDNTGSSIVQIVTSNPVGRWRSISGGIIKILSSARNYVYMQTPYFMPNDKVLSAMQNAALSGIDVRLMIPRRSDNRLADYATYSYLEELISAGIKVYTYENGFLHAKTLVCDDMLCSVGSANLDFRSFDYNFEANAYIYDAAVARRMKSLFMDDVKACSLLSINDLRKRSIKQRCLESAARLVSPIL